MTDKKVVTLKGVELMWAQLDKVNDMSGKYQVDLVNLTGENLDAVKSLGITGIRKDDKRPEKGTFITCKSSKPIVALDTNGDRITDPVGNGSTANIRLGAYSWTSPNGKTKGVSGSIEKLVIKDLVVYTKDDGDDDDDLL